MVTGSEQGTRRSVGPGWAILAVLALLIGASWLTAELISQDTARAAQGGAGSSTSAPSATPSTTRPSTANTATASTPASPTSLMSPSASATPPSPSPSASQAAADGTGAQVRFRPGVVRLAAVSLPDLDTVAVYLKAHPDAVATVVGLPDPTGGGANAQVSWSRAQNVTNYLVSRGVQQAQVTTTISLSARHPVSAGTVVGVQVLTGKVG